MANDKEILDKYIKEFEDLKEKQEKELLQRNKEYELFKIQEEMKLEKQRKDIEVSLYKLTFKG